MESWSDKTVNREECGISMPIRTVGHYLSVGDLPRRSRSDAYEQRPEAVKQFNEQIRILPSALELKAGDSLGDETGLVNTDARTCLHPRENTRDLRSWHAATAVNDCHRNQQAVHAGRLLMEISIR